MSKIEPLKVVIDLLGLDIENLVHAEKKEAIEALEHSLLTLIEKKIEENLLVKGVVNTLAKKME